MEAPLLRLLHVIAEHRQRRARHGEADLDSGHTGTHST
jgi:hypothetical protein